MRIIPAIDIIEGKCVRLSKGNYTTKIIYNEDPLEVAKQFEDNGIRYLHLVDLDGARSNHIVNEKVLYNIARGTNLKIDFGGGIKSDRDVKIAFQNGADQVTAGSIAVTDQNKLLEWLTYYGASKIILGADCADRKISINGWQQRSEIDVLDFIQKFELAGIRTVICTDVSKDGMLQGSSNDLYKEIILHSRVNLVASGGVSSLNDVLELKILGCEGTIIGKAIYEGRITLKELSALC